MMMRCLLMAGLFTGCATVPDDAPQEFFDAEAAIDEMESQDVDDLFPKTAELAHNNFDTALDRLDESRDNPPTATEADAISKASEARETAEGAIRLNASVLAWDESQTAFRDALAMLDGPEMVAMETTEAPVSPFAKLEGTEFVSTVAFFETDDAESPVMNEGELEALVGILEKDTGYQVVVTGHTDPRGSDNYNQKLAMRRAETIAKKIKSSGVSEEQIIVESAGEADARSEEGDNSKLLLDRRVRAKVILR